MLAFVLYQLDENFQIKHEEISILIFKHILSTNMKVLSEFVASGLSWEEVWKIEFMIHPDMVFTFAISFISDSTSHVLL